MAMTAVGSAALETTPSAAGGLFVGQHHRPLAVAVGHQSDRDVVGRSDSWKIQDAGREPAQPRTRIVQLTSKVGRQGDAGS